MEAKFDQITLDAVLHTMDIARFDDEEDDVFPIELRRRADHFSGTPLPTPPKDEAKRVARERKTIRPHLPSSPTSLTPAANERILLVGGPYRGTYVRENIDANGVYLVSGASGDFVYRLYQRKHERAIAVPFDATPSEVRDALFKQAAKQTHRRQASPRRNMFTVENGAMA